MSPTGVYLMITFCVYLTAVCPPWSPVCAVPQNPPHVLLLLSPLITVQYPGSPASGCPASDRDPTPRATVLVQISRFTEKYCVYKKQNNMYYIYNIYIHFFLQILHEQFAQALFVFQKSSSSNTKANKLYSELQNISMVSNSSSNTEANNLYSELQNISMVSNQKK